MKSRVLVIVLIIAAIPVVLFGPHALRAYTWNRAVSRSELLQSDGRFEEALAALEAAEAWRGEYAGAAQEKSRELRLAWAEALLAQNESAAAGKLFESLGESLRAADAYEAAGQLGDMERLYVRLNLVREMAELYAARQKWEDAARLYGRAKAADEQAEMLRNGGKREAALKVLQAAGRKLGAKEFAEAGLWAEAAVAYEKDENWPDALGAHERAGNLRGVASALEKLGRFKNAAEVCEGLAQKDGDIGVRLDAARLYGQVARLDGASPSERVRASQKARVFLDNALAIAKGFSNYTEILKISQDLAQLAAGLEYVLAEGDRLAASQQIFEAKEAYLSVQPYLGPNTALDVKTNNRLVDRVDVAITALMARLDEYPKLDKIEGVNQYNQLHQFDYTEVKGLIHNTTGKVVEQVVVRIKLFKKKTDDMSMLGALNPTVFTAQLNKFNSAAAGYTKDIVIKNLAAGESRSFAERFANAVPYTYFNYPMTGLRLEAEAADRQNAE
jgi:tetratricopeptide (TPR) repeat protein